MMDSIKIPTKANSDHDSMWGLGLGVGLWCGGADWVVAQGNKGTAYCLFKFSCPELRSALQRSSRESSQMFLHICQEGLSCIYE